MLFYNPYFLFCRNGQIFSVHNRDNEDYFLSQGEKYGGQGEKYGAQGEKYGSQGEKYGKNGPTSESVFYIRMATLVPVPSL